MALLMITCFEFQSNSKSVCILLLLFGLHFSLHSSKFMMLSVSTWPIMSLYIKVFHPTFTKHCIDQLNVSNELSPRKLQYVNNYQQC